MEYMPNPWESWQPEIPRNKRGKLQYPWIEQGYAVIYSDNVDKGLMNPGKAWHSMEKSPAIWHSMGNYTSIYQYIVGIY